MNINFKEDDETFLILPSFVLFDLRRLKNEKVTEIMDIMTINTYTLHVR